MTAVDFDWSALSVSVILLATVCLALVFDMGKTERWAKPTGGVAILGTLLALGFAVWGTQDATLAFGARDGMNNPVAVFLVDAHTRTFTILFLLGTLLSAFLSLGYLDRHEIQRGEYYVLMLLSALGMILMAGGNDLIIIFLGLELLSLPLYVLAGFLRNRESSESSLKYFLLGAFSSGFFLYGIALIYGATGTTNLSVLASAAPGSETLFRAGILLLLVGFGFKAAAVPFHQWVPDVYTGAPTAVTAFFSVAPKAAAFAGILRVFLASSPTFAEEWTTVFAVLAALTMTVGNILAIVQTNIKRMLAYSSVAHAGYVLVAFAAGGAEGISAALFYLFAYTLMNLGAFGCVILNGSKEDEHLSLDDYAGIGHKRPLLGAAMTVFMLSLAGFPPTVGFIGKFLIFRHAYESGLGWLVIIGVLNSVVSAFFYLGVVVKMYMAKPTREIAASRLAFVPQLLFVLTVLIAFLGVLYAGIVPSQLMDVVQGATPPAETASMLH